jgi:hypothetical protein
LNKRCSNRLAGITVVPIEYAVAKAYSGFSGWSCGVEEEVTETGSVFRESAFSHRSWAVERRVSRYG